MKKHYSYIFLSLIVLTIFIACTIEPDKGSSLVTITIGKEGSAASVHIEKYTFFVKAERFVKGLMPYEAFAAVPSIVKVISFEISGSDMDTITRDVIVSGQSQITEAFEVANGDSRVFSVKGKDSSGTALYSGSTTENLDGTDVSITITLKRVNTSNVTVTVSGLTGTGLVLQNNGVDDLSISTDGSFTFSTSIADDSNYSVTVLTQPSLQTCTVISGGGPLSGANIASVVVLCLDNVIPLYSSAPNWNDYVQWASPTTACTGAETGGYQSCIHGGESLTVGLPAETDCNGVSATDALGAFEWWCDPSGSPVKMVSKGLADGKYLSDLILDFVQFIVGQAA